MTLSVQPAIAIFDTARGEACGVAPVGVADPTFFAPVTKTQREAGGVRALATNDAGQLVDPDGNVGGAPAAVTTGGALTAGGAQVGGTAIPIPLTTNRNAADTDNGQVLVCDAARTYTITAGQVSGFGVALIPYSATTLTITGGTGVTINGALAGTVTRAQASNSAVAVIQVGTDSYLVTGS